MTDADVQTLAEYCRENLNLADIRENPNYGYQSLPLCIIDAIFSMGVRYSSTRNTVRRFIERFPDYATFSIHDFIDVYRRHSMEFMAKEVYNNRQRTSPRNGILKAEAVLNVAEILQIYGVHVRDDMEKVVNNPKFEAEYKKIRGQRSGISLRYFYMLTGVTTQIKPDRMILRFIGNALQRNVTVDECPPLITALCEHLQADYPDITPRSLDRAIWQFQRTRRP